VQINIVVPAWSHAYWRRDTNRQTDRQTYRRRARKSRCSL